MELRCFKHAVPPWKVGPRTCQCPCSCHLDGIIDLSDTCCGHPFDFCIASQLGSPKVMTTPSIGMATKGLWMATYGRQKWIYIISIKLWKYKNVSNSLISPKILKNATIFSQTSPGRDGGILPWSFYLILWKTGLPIFHGCHQSHGNQWLLPDHPLHMAHEKKYSLTKKMIQPVLNSVLFWSDRRVPIVSL